MDRHTVLNNWHLLLHHSRHVLAIHDLLSLGVHRTRLVLAVHDGLIRDDHHDRLHLVLSIHQVRMTHIGVVRSEIVVFSVMLHPGHFNLDWRNSSSRLLFLAAAEINAEAKPDTE